MVLLQGAHAVADDPFSAAGEQALHSVGRIGCSNGAIRARGEVFPLHHEMRISGSCFSSCLPCTLHEVLLGSVH